MLDTVFIVNTVQFADPSQMIIPSLRKPLHSPLLRYCLIGDSGAVFEIDVEAFMVVLLLSRRRSEANVHIWSDGVKADMEVPSREAQRCNQLAK
jgi:hypothetical protein